MQRLGLGEKVLLFIPTHGCRQNRCMIIPHKIVNICHCLWWKGRRWISKRRLWTDYGPCLKSKSKWFYIDPIYLLGQQDCLFYPSAEWKVIIQFIFLSKKRFFFWYILFLHITFLSIYIPIFTYIWYKDKIFSSGSQRDSARKN